MQYRPEIDGLRAVAVWSVVLYHAGLLNFSGGFLGVDVFFVISGYLISSIIFIQLTVGQFSFLAFYDRRIRRLFPPLLVMLMIMTPIVSFVAPPEVVRQFGNAMASALIFMSNVFFFNSAGYWEAAADENLLIHTWSLSVEEQFYLVFPAITALFFIRNKRVFVLLMFLAFGLSLSLAQAAHNYCCWVQSFNFYMISSRVWELCLGIFAALILRIPVWHTRFSTLPLSFGLQFFGMVAIGSSMFLFDDQTPHPSLITLLPTLGAFFFILGLSVDSWLGRLMSSRPLVYLGLTSYSLYIWHQPIFALHRVTTVENLNYKNIVICIILSFILAHFSHKYVEKFFRNQANYSRSRIFSLAVGISLFLAVVGILLGTKNIHLNLYERSLSENQKFLYSAYRAANDINFDAQIRPSKYCRYHTKNIDKAFVKAFQKCVENNSKVTLIIGDSHGMNLFNILVDTEQNEPIFSISRAGCNYSRNNPCVIDGLREFLQANKNNIRRLVYHQSGAYLLRDIDGNIDGKKLFLVPGGQLNSAGMERVVRILNQFNEIVPLLWLGPFPEPQIDFEKFIHLEKPLQVNPISKSIFIDLDDAIRNYIAQKSKFRFVGFTELFSHDNNNLIKSSCLLYRDLSHFSLCGEQSVAKTYIGGTFLESR